MKSSSSKNRAAKGGQRGESTILQKSGQFVSDLRHDPKALLELRQLLFILLIICGLGYASYTFFIEAKMQDLGKERARGQELSNLLAGGRLEQMTATQIQQLMTQKKDLQENIELLQGQKQELRRQFAEISGEVAFANAVLGLLPESPLDLDKIIAEMLVMEPAMSDGFDVFPVAMRGQGQFGDFLAYLEYVEERPEVGIVTDVRLEQGVDVSLPSAYSVKYELILGRVQLH